MELAYEESQQTALCPEAAQEVQVNIGQYVLRAISTCVSISTAKKKSFRDRRSKLIACNYSRQMK